MNTHVGVGIMQEDEPMILRESIYVTFAIYQLHNVEDQTIEKLQIENTAYFQFDTKRAEDNRALYDGDLSIAINESLSFNFTINYRRDSEPHGDVGNTYIQLKNGLEFIFNLGRDYIK